MAEVDAAAPQVVELRQVTRPHQEAGDERLVQHGMLAEQPQAVLPRLFPKLPHPGGLAGGQQFWGDVFGVVLEAGVLVFFENDFAAFHEGGDDLALLRGVFLTERDAELGEAEATRPLSKLEKIAIPVEDEIDRLDCPALVEDEAVAEQVFLVKHRSRVVQVAQQGRAGSRAHLLFFANGVELLEGDVRLRCRPLQQRPAHLVPAERHLHAHLRHFQEGFQHHFL